MYNINHYKHLFIQNFEEVEKCKNNFSNYSLIKISSALRLLLWDSYSLLELLNREKMIPIKFCVHDQFEFPEDEVKSAIMIWREINPMYSNQIKELKLSAFLKRDCAVFMQKRIKVIDILKFYAYGLGGIHIPKNDQDYEDVRLAFNTMKINYVSNLDHSMRGIVQVVYTTLNKYKNALLN